LLADADELECRIARNGSQQAAAGHDIGHRKDELDATCFDRGDDGRAFELDRVISFRQQIRVHARSPTDADAAKHRRRYLSGNQGPPQRTYCRHIGRRLQAPGKARIMHPHEHAMSRLVISRLVVSCLAAALVVAIICGSTDATCAGDWPTRPVRIIAPSTPGGAGGLVGPPPCDHFSEAFHERCFVENRAGAGGLIGMAAAAQAAPDGYTLTTSSIAYNVIAPAVSPNPGFDPIKDFTHIAYIGGPPNVFVVN